MGAQGPSGRPPLPAPLACPTPAPTLVQASVTSSPGYDSQLQCPPLCHLSLLSHLAKSSHTVFPKARASPSSDIVLLFKEQCPNFPSGKFKPSQTTLPSPLPASPAS